MAEKTKHKEQAILFSDLHAHNYAEFDVDGARLAWTLKALTLMFKYADTNGIKYILFAGDLYHKQGAVPTLVVNAMIKKLKALFSKYPDIMLIAITGNHDQAGKNLWHKPAPSALTNIADRFDNFKLIDNDHIELEGIVNIYGIPYYEYAEDFKKALDATANKASLGGVNLLLIHQTPSNLDNPNIPFDTDVNDSMYAMFNRTYCGHIHKRQDINPRLTVIGAPLHHDLGDAGNEKGFLVIDLYNLEGNYEFVSTRGLFPEYIALIEGSEIPEDGVTYYVVREPDVTAMAQDSDINPEHFVTTLSPTQLVTNYCEQVVKDPELLKVGLTFLS